MASTAAVATFLLGFTFLRKKNAGTVKSVSILPIAYGSVFSVIVIAGGTTPVRWALKKSKKLKNDPSPKVEVLPKVLPILQRSI